MSTITTPSNVVPPMATSGWTKIFPEQVDALKKNFSLPLVTTANEEIFPVDNAGFVFPGKRWDVGVPPSDEHLAIAKKFMLSVQGCSGNRGGKGIGRSVSLYEIKEQLEHLCGADYTTNGAMIVAASQLGWKIERESLNGIVVVSRKWWNSIGRSVS